MSDSPRRNHNIPLRLYCSLRMEDSYTLHLAEGWSVLLNSKEGIYTVSRDRRQMTFNTQLPLPPCLATYNLTFEHGKKQMTIPSHVVDVLNSRVGVTLILYFLLLLLFYFFTVSCVYIIFSMCVVSCIVAFFVCKHVYIYLDMRVHN